MRLYSRDLFLLVEILKFSHIFELASNFIFYVKDDPGLVILLQYEYCKTVQCLYRVKLRS